MLNVGKNVNELPILYTEILTIINIYYKDIKSPVQTANKMLCWSQKCGKVV